MVKAWPGLKATAPDGGRRIHFGKNNCFLGKVNIHNAGKGLPRLMLGGGVDDLASHDGFSSVA